MRIIFFHCKNYKIEIGRLSNRPKDISPEKIKNKSQDVKDCIVALINVEKGDNIQEISKEFVLEITKMLKDVKHDNVVLLPFAHLSNNLAETKYAILFIDGAEKELQKDFNVFRGHFGSHKSLLLDIYGHPGNARYREF